MAVREARGRSVDVQSTVAPEIVRPLSGWGLVALSFTNVAIAYAVVFSFPVFLPVLVNHFHASRGTVVSAFSWAMFMIGITAVLVAARSTGGGLGGSSVPAPSPSRPGWALQRSPTRSGCSMWVSGSGVE